MLTGKLLQLQDPIRVMQESTVILTYMLTLVRTPVMLMTRQYFSVKSQPLERILKARIFILMLYLTQHLQDPTQGQPL